MKWYLTSIVIFMVTHKHEAQTSNGVCSMLSPYKTEFPVEFYSVTYDTFQTSKQEFIKILSDNTPELTSKLLKRNKFDKYVRTQSKYVYGTWLNLIDLSNNGIITIEKEAFSEISLCLQYIYLKSNLIEHIESETFHKLYQLRKLDLSNNKIRLIDSYAFNQTNLDQLILSQNQLTNLTNEEIFYNLKNITYLDLSYNQIKEIKSFKYLENLDELNLSHNNLSTLTSNLFIHLTNLTHLKLDSNFIQQITIGVFKNLKSLQTLSLGGNQIKDFQLGSFYGLNNLRELNVSYNLLLNTYEQKLFTIDNLRTLILDGNNISSTINVREIMSHLLKLRSISLANMPWNCSHLLVVMKQFALRGINVRENILPDHINEINIKGILCNDTDVKNGTEVSESLMNLAESLSENNVSLVPQDSDQEQIIKGLIYDHKTIHQILIFLVVINIVVLISIFKEDITSVLIKRHKRQLMLNNHHSRTNIVSQSEVELMDSR